jgi:predicted molibdopterin-dependent oxidoreductase YjgC
MEGRVTVLDAKISPAGTARPDWMIAVEIADRLGHDLGFTCVEDITDAIAATVPAFSGVTRAELAANSDGVLVDRPGTGVLPTPGIPANEPGGYAYRLVTSRKLYDGAVSTQLSPSLAGLTAAGAVHLHPLDLDRVGVKPGTEVRLSSARGAMVIPAVGDHRVPRGSAWVPFNIPGVDIGDLIDATSEVCDVIVESLGTGDALGSADR